MAEIALSVALIAFEGAIVYLNNKMNEKASHQAKCDFEKAKSTLREMEAIQRDSEDQIDEGSQRYQVYIQHVQDIAHAIEDVADEFLLAVEASRSQNTLKKVIKSAARKFSTNMKSKVYIKREDLSQWKCDPPSSSASASSSSRSNQDLEDSDELVGFETYEEELLKKLKEQSHLYILVSGPGGSGKSSLVKRIYRRDEVFSVRNWFQVPELLSLEKKKVPELQSGLGEQKSLVVLDEVWRKEDLGCIVHALARDTLGSKLVIISRNSDIASCLNPKYIVDLSRGLSREKAKELFCNRVFHDGQGNWPPELNEWAQKILDKCDGIPLAISAVATFLVSKQNETPLEWMGVYNSLGTELCDGFSLSIIRRNLQPSYRELPSHLRDCFLYFSMFPGGDEISRERLIRLWVAENFATPKGRKTAEQVAKDHLNELVQRNLVVVCKAGRRNRVSNCRVLKLVREINVSRRKNFITVLESDSIPSCHNIRRLSAHNGNFNLIKYTSTYGVRTFLVFGQASSPDLIMVLGKSKFLRVLDLQGVPNLKQFPQQVFDLILLRYLSMKDTQVETVPNRIKKLVNLETLDLKRTQVTKLPEGVYKLHKLRNLLVSSCSGNSQRVQLGVDISKGVSSLSSIHKLSLIKVKNTESIQALGELKDLRKLGVVVLETTYGKQLCTALQEMKRLVTLDVRASEPQSLYLDECKTPPKYLERLHLSGTLQQGLPKWISKSNLDSVQKISLHRSDLNQNPLDHLQDLCNLIELDLWGYYNGNELIFKTDKFGKLESLILGRFSRLESLVFENGAAPKLKKLTISECHNLKETGIMLPAKLRNSLQVSRPKRTSQDGSKETEATSLKHGLQL